MEQQSRADRLEEVQGLMGTGRPNEAITILDGMLSEDSTDAEVHSLIGVAYAMSGKNEDGIKHLERASRLDPTEPSYLANLGFAYERVGSIENAIQTYRRAVHLDPQNQRAAMALQRLGESVDSSPSEPTQETRIDAGAAEGAVHLSDPSGQDVAGQPSSLSPMNETAAPSASLSHAVPEEPVA